MRLLYAAASPYSAKVRMGAALAGIALQAEITETVGTPEALVAANPLGKIPVLVLDDGTGVYDSRVILRLLDRRSGGKLFPSEAEALLRTERLEALADGICDCLLAHVMERRTRPEEKVHEPWLERQWQKAVRGLDAAAAQLPDPEGPSDAGTLALRAAIGYLALRFAGRWEADHRSVTDWAARFDAKNPGLGSLLPA